MIRGRVSATLHRQFQEMRGAADAGVVVADGLLAQPFQVFVGQGEVGGHGAVQVLLDLRLSMPKAPLLAGNARGLGGALGPKQPWQPRPTEGQRLPHPALGDRAEAGRAMGDGDAGGAFPLALCAWRIARDMGFAAGDGRQDQLQQLVFGDRAAAQFEIHFDVVRDGGRGGEGGAIVGMRLDQSCLVGHVGEVAQGLDACRRGTGADGDGRFGLGPDLADAGGVVGGGDGAFDQREVIGAVAGDFGRLDELGDVERSIKIQMRSWARLAAIRLCTAKRIMISGPQTKAEIVSGGTAASAWSKAVVATPTGHQAMQRPQPTQPEAPNWMAQHDSLWVIHCR